MASDKWRFDDKNGTETRPTEQWVRVEPEAEKPKPKARKKKKDDE